MTFCQRFLFFHVKKFNPNINTWTKGNWQFSEAGFHEKQQALRGDVNYRRPEVYAAALGKARKHIYCEPSMRGITKEGRFRVAQNGWPALGTVAVLSSYKMGSWKVYKILLWAEQLNSFIFILTSSDPGSRTLTVLASCSVIGCTNKAFPGEKHKHGCGHQDCISSEQQLCALGLSASHSHFRGLLGHAMCSGSLPTGKKGMWREPIAAWALFCCGTGMQLGCTVYPPAWRHFWVPRSLKRGLPVCSSVEQKNTFF